MTISTVAHARKTDPATSHAAARRASINIGSVKWWVLRVIADRGPCIGSEVNQYYVADDRAPRAAWDTPRKRAGDLARAGLLMVGEDPRDGESEYVLTFAGYQFLEATA